VGVSVGGKGVFEGCGVAVIVEVGGKGVSVALDVRDGDGVGVGSMGVKLPQALNVSRQKIIKMVVMRRAIAGILPRFCFCKVRQMGLFDLNRSTCLPCLRTPVIFVLGVTPFCEKSAAKGREKVFRALVKARPAVKS